ncbi:hypothetical protein [Winogradskya humida]|uniref:Uncharacterized protein n=1 Tax=Winogradskya humida TaxID=113566 RepID=A0ABQ3ZVM3_9ACTN|nr:hypothetical protein [Actinoplanes humidus]GIE22616.1 hypothetical protein Ahu01nite_057180 [Actinoplanes humidus]
MTLPRPPRRFVAEDVLAGRVNLDGYPFRYIYLGIPYRLDFRLGDVGELARVDVVMSAVELLETRGWEFLHFLEGGQLAFLRRVTNER